MFSRFNESSHTFISTHLIRPDRSGELELPLPGPEGGGNWSRDGSLIAVMTVLDDDRIGTAIIKPDGTVDRVLEIADATLNAVCTVWSRDDTRLACEAWDDTDPSRAGIYTVLAADGGDLTRLTTVPDGMTDLPGDYSPDGTHLVFKRTRGEDNAPLFMVNVAAGGEAQPLGDQSFEDPGRFSPDGEAVLTSAGGQITLIDLDGGVRETLVDPQGFAFGPVWSPDGEWIAYSRAISRRHRHQPARWLAGVAGHRHECQRDPRRMGCRLPDRTLIHPRVGDPSWNMPPPGNSSEYTGKPDLRLPVGAWLRPRPTGGRPAHLSRDVPNVRFRRCAGRSQLSPRAKLEILGAILLAMFLFALDQTVVGTALPVIVTELGGNELLHVVGHDLPADVHDQRPDLRQTVGPVRPAADHPVGGRAVPGELGAGRA